MPGLETDCHEVHGTLDCHLVGPIDLLAELVKFPEAIAGFEIFCFEGEWLAALLLALVLGLGLLGVVILGL